MSKKQKQRKQAEIAQKKRIHSHSRDRESAFEARVKWIGILAAAALIIVAVVFVSWSNYRSNVLAYVGNETVTRSEVQTLLDQTLAQYEQQGMQITPDSAEYSMFWESSLEAAIQEKLALKEANARGIIPTADQIQAEVTRTASQLTMTETAMKDAVIQQGRTWNDFLDTIKVQLQRQQIWEDVTGTITVLATETASSLESQRVTYDTPEQAAVRFLFLSNILENNKGRTEEGTKTLGEEILAKLKAGESFESLVTQYSEDPPSKEKNGDLGYINRGAYNNNFGTDFETTAFSTPVGQTSALVPLKNGYGILQVYGHIPAYTAQLGDRWNFTFQQIQTPTLADAQATLEKLKGGADFSELAKATSTDTTTATSGGDKGTVARKDLKDWQLAALKDLPVDQVSAIATDGTNYFIFKLNKVETIDQVLTNNLLTTKQNDAWSKFIEELKTKTKVITV